MVLEIVIISLFLVLVNITDIRSFKIKNKTVLPFLIIGIIIGIVQNHVTDHLLGMIIPMVLFPFYALRMLGAGDIKALCAIGAVVGFHKSVEVMLFTFIAGGIIAVLFMAFNKNFIKRMKYLFGYFKVCFLTRKIQNYDFGGGEKSFFRFCYAITCGTVLMFLNFYFKFLVL